MPSSAEKTGDFSEDCLRVENPSSAAARLFEQRREAAGHGRGCRLLWLLSFGQAKESDSPKGEKEWFKFHHFTLSLTLSLRGREDNMHALAPAWILPCRASLFSLKIPFLLTFR